MADISKIRNVDDPSKVFDPNGLVGYLSQKYPEHADAYKKMDPNDLAKQAISSGAWEVPPTEAPSVTGLVSKKLDPYKPAAESILSGVGDLIHGAATSVTGIPGIVIRGAGLLGVGTGNPQDYNLPFGITKSTTDPLTAIGLPGTTTSSPMTYGDLEEAPNTVMGKVGQFAGDVASYALPETGLVKGAEALGLASKAKKVLGAERAYRTAETVGHSVASGGLQGAQTYLRTGDKDAAINSGLLGTAIPAGIEAAKGATGIALGVADAVKDAKARGSNMPVAALDELKSGESARGLAQSKGEALVTKTIPFPEGTKIEEMRPVANRAGATNTRMNREGAISAQKRWSDTSANMFNASTEAESNGVKIDPSSISDEVKRIAIQRPTGGEETSSINRSAEILKQTAKRLDTSHVLIDPATGKPVINQVTGKTVPLQPMPAVDPTTGTFNAPLTPTQAEWLKHDMNERSGEIFNKKRKMEQLKPEEVGDSELFKAIADGIRKEQYAKIGNVVVDGKKIPYKDAGNIARLDATLAGYAESVAAKNFRGSSSPGLVGNVTLGEILTGHVLKPSQIGWGIHKVLGPAERYVGTNLIQGPKSEAYFTTKLLGPIVKQTATKTPPKSNVEINLDPDYVPNWSK